MRTGSYQSLGRDGAPAADRSWPVATEEAPCETVLQLRQRRPRFGELVQIDGSPHDWFEGRGPRCTLIVFIDDATSRLTALHFAPVESGKAYLAASRFWCTAVHWRSIRTGMAFSG